MYFSRITFNTGSVDHNSFENIFDGNLYAIHEVLWKLFPKDPNARRDFLFCMENKNGWPFFYMVSNRQPQTNKPAITIESKPYQPKLKIGQQFSFSLRANPIVMRKNVNGKRSRHDVVMDAKRNLNRPFSTEDSISSGELEHMAGAKWLITRSERLGFEFDPDELRIFGYQQHRFKSRKQKKIIKLSSLDFSGHLTVLDPNKFRQTLFNGIGPAKAFGCGLMLIRRI